MTNWVIFQRHAAALIYFLPLFYARHGSHLHSSYCVWPGVCFPHKTIHLSIFCFVWDPVLSLRLSLRSSILFPSLAFFEIQYPLFISGFLWDLVLFPITVHALVMNSIIWVLDGDRIFWWGAGGAGGPLTLSGKLHPRCKLHLLCQEMSSLGISKPCVKAFLKHWIFAQFSFSLENHKQKNAQQSHGTAQSKQTEQSYLEIIWCVTDWVKSWGSDTWKIAWCK